MRRTSGLVLTALVCVQATAVSGQVLLLDPSVTVSDPITFSTPAGKQEALAQEASFDPAIAVILNPPAFGGSDAQALNASLLSLLRKGGAPAIELTLLQPGDTALVSAVRTRQQLSAAMKTIAAAVPDDAAPVSFDLLMEYLKGLPDSNPAWKQVIFTGPEPDVPASLRDYAFGMLARTLSSRRIRLVHYRAEDMQAGSWDPVLTSTGGGVFNGDLSVAIDVSGAWAEAKIPVWGPPGGFRVAPFSTGGRTTPWIWSIGTGALPSPAQYADFLEQRAVLSKVPGTDTTPSTATGLKTNLTTLLAVNPYDPDTLNLAVDISERTKDYAAGTKYASRIAEMDANNGANFARLGFFRWSTGDSTGAEHDLLRARELHADHPQSAAILGDIHSATRDYPAAAIEYTEAVKREPDRVELWLKLADTQQAQGHKPEVAQALEEVLKRKPEMWDRRTQIIDYYLGAGDGIPALRQTRAGIALLPADAVLVARFAMYSERLEQPGDAAKLWSRTIELDHTNEVAYYSLTRLHVTAKAWDQALKTAEAGVSAVPTSARLHAYRVDALTALGRLDDARQVARNAADQIADPALASRAAGYEDRYGSDSPKYYQAAVETLRARSAKDEEWKPLAERGMFASIREQQPVNCEWFATLLASKSCTSNGSSSTASTIAIPGGIRALLFVTHGPLRSSPKVFLADYSRTLAAIPADYGQKAADDFRIQVLEYFRMLNDLKSMGAPVNGKTVVRLSLGNNKAKQTTEQVLGMLGWRARSQGGKLIVEPATAAGSAKHQTLASALDIDVLAMQESLQSGKDFELEIPEDSVEIYPAEDAWRQQFYPGERFAGGFAEAMIRKPEMALLYTALSQMEPSAADILAASGLKYMAQKYGNLLVEYSSCLEVSLGLTQVPGGSPAIPIWEELAGVSPNQPGKFLRALLDRDEGRLIRFYFLLSQLDFTRQKFFTASAARTKAFYGVFRQSSQVERKQAINPWKPQIEDFFRELPLNDDGRILFPGGPAVWLVAKNQSSSVQATEKRFSKLSRVTTPEVEDEILLRLLRDEYTEKGNLLAAWQSFLAVVRVDATRTDPLDETSALLLAEKYATNHGLYGYFAGLTGLDALDYREILSFSEKIPGLDRKKTNLAVGLFQSWLYLLASAERSGRIPPATTATLLLGFARAMNQSSSPSQWSHASLDLLTAYVEAAGGDKNNKSLDDILLPQVADHQVDLPDGHSVNPRESMRKNFARVLELQKVPATGDLIGVHQALLNLSSAHGIPSESVKVLKELMGNIQDIEIPRKQALSPADAEALKQGLAARFTELNSELEKEAAKKKIDVKHLQSLADDYWEALATRTLTSLAGQIYALNFRQDDLLIAEDPLFLRKQQFVPWENLERDYFQPAALDVSSGQGGSRVTGSFEGIATVAGRAGATSLKDADSASSFVQWALLGAVRATNWTPVNQAALRSFATRIHAAQDWLVLAATQPRLLEQVGVVTYGLLSLNRRTRLLAALRADDWRDVWSSVSTSDLFFLASRLKAVAAATKGVTGTAESPAIDEYLATPDNPEADDAVGPLLTLLRRRLGTSMVELPPYEEIAAASHPTHLAERVAEFKLCLVRLFESNSLPADALPAVAEAAARAVASDIHMTNLRDWTGVLEAYERFDGARLKEVMGTL